MKRVGLFCWRFGEVGCRGTGDTGNLATDENTDRTRMMAERWGQNDVRMLRILPLNFQNGDRVFSFCPYRSGNMNPPNGLFLFDSFIPRVFSHPRPERTRHLGS